jgi:transposase
MAIAHRAAIRADDRTGPPLADPVRLAHSGHSGLRAAGVTTNGMVRPVLLASCCSVDTRGRTTMMRNKPRDADVYGVDIKNIFHVVGVDADGTPIQRLRCRRETLIQFFQRAALAVVGMEACPGSQWLARKIPSFGHTVKIVPAQFVKPYLKSNKNDTLDAEAIAEAITRPTMRFVEVKAVEQIDTQALHRARDQMLMHRTRLISQMRAFCLEYGVAIRQGAGVFKLDLPRILEDHSNDLSPAIRWLLAELLEDLHRLEGRIAEITREIEALVSRDEVARRLMTIPGIGPLGSSALLAAVGQGRQFKKARDLSAWLGLVPRQYSTGGKPTLLGISKRGNGYVRRLLIHGARSCVMHLDRSWTRLGAWIDRLETRMHANKVVVALANKIARLAWVVLNRPGTLYERIDPAFG